MATTEKRGLRVCLVGCGSMGRLHGESILRHSNLSSLSLCDVDPSPARELACELGVEWLPLAEALSSSMFDAFFIVTPPWRMWNNWYGSSRMELMCSVRNHWETTWHPSTPPCRH